MAARPAFGVCVGIAAAVLLAVSPESVATSRDSTMDALMMAQLVLAAVVLQRAVEQRSTGWPIVWAVVMGLVVVVKALGRGWL